MCSDGRPPDRLVGIIAVCKSALPPPSPPHPPSRPCLSATPIMRPHIRIPRLMRPMRGHIRRASEAPFALVRARLSLDRRLSRQRIVADGEVHRLEALDLVA